MFSFGSGSGEWFEGRFFSTGTRQDGVNHHTTEPERSKHMITIDKNTIETVKLMAKGLAGDRKGATALEYALIAGALAAVTLVGFRTFFNRINEYLVGISFT